MNKIIQKYCKIPIKYDIRRDRCSNLKNIKPTATSLRLQGRLLLLHCDCRVDYCYFTATAELATATSLQLQGWLLQLQLLHCSAVLLCYCSMQWYCAGL